MDKKAIQEGYAMVQRARLSESGNSLDEGFGDLAAAFLAKLKPKSKKSQEIPMPVVNHVMDALRAQFPQTRQLVTSIQNALAKEAREGSVPLSALDRIAKGTKREFPDLGTDVLFQSLRQTFVKLSA
jgi:hypothetical protein